MSNVVLSKNTEILIDDELLNGITNFSLDRGVGTIDLTDIYSVQEIFAAGLKTVKSTATINVDDTDTVHEKLDDPGATVNLKIYPNGQLSGKGFDIDMIVTSFNRSVPKGDKITASVEFTPAGLLTKLGA
jgi:hypothetical protein